MHKIAVIADDLTGAGDTGAQFSRAGLRTRVLFGNWTQEDTQGSAVIVANSDSRAMTLEAAYGAVFKATKDAASAGFLPVFKKLDSTLRGPVGRELDAMMDASGCDVALLCPAFPANRRTVQEGVLLVDGVPVSGTAIAMDPVAPVKESRIAVLLAGQSLKPVREAGRSVLAAGEAAIHAELGRLRSSGGGIMVCDAESDADLELLARAGLSFGSGLILAGSAGLALPAALLFGADDTSASVHTAPSLRTGPGPKINRPVLVALGSVNPVSRAQAASLVAAGAVEVCLDPAEVLGEPVKASATLEYLGLSAGKILAAGGTPLLSILGSRSDIAAAQAAGALRGMDHGAVATVLATSLACAVCIAIDGGSPDTAVVATGGDVARAILEAFGAGAVDILGEVSPGLPLGAVVGGSCPGRLMVTKAGGFGPPDALERSVKMLREFPE